MLPIFRLETDEAYNLHLFSASLDWNLDAATIANFIGEIEGNALPGFDAVGNRGADTIGARNGNRQQVHHLVLPDISDKGAGAADDEAGHRHLRVALDRHMQGHIGEAARHQEMILVIDLELEKEGTSARV